MKSILSTLFLAFFFQSVYGQYATYRTDDRNHSVQSVIQTSDGGFLVAAGLDCYTPRIIAIEGCATGTLLIKTNSVGDTLWTKHLAENFANDIFENADGTFTIINADHGTIKCNDIWAGLYGLANFSIINITADGDKISEFVFPEQCELVLKDFARISDSSYVIFTEYWDLTETESSEGRLFILSNSGAITNVNVFPFRSIHNLELKHTETNEILLFYADTSEILHLNVYDHELNLLNSVSNSNFIPDCLTEFGSKANLHQLSDDDFLVTCAERGYPIRTISFYHFDPDLQVISKDTFSLIEPVQEIITDNNQIIIPSINKIVSQEPDVLLNYFSIDGVYLHSYQFGGPGPHQPQQIIKLANDRIAVTGRYNHWNLPDSIGPGQSFLYLGDVFVSTQTAEDLDQVDVFPTPFSNQLNIRFSEIPAGNFSLKIYSITGQLLHHETITSSSVSIETSGIPPGITILTISKDNNLILRQKLVRI